VTRIERPVRAARVGVEGEDEEGIDGPTCRPPTSTKTTSTIPSGSTSPRQRRLRPRLIEALTMALCKAMIIGNLGADPECATPNGRPVTQFNVAVNQSTKNQQTGEWVEATDWFRVSVWGDRAERAAETLRKGNKVFVEGRFKTREFEGGTARSGPPSRSPPTASSTSRSDRARRARGQFAAPAAAAAGSGAAGGSTGGPSRGGGGGGNFDDTELDDLPF